MYGSRKKMKTACNRLQICVYLPKKVIKRTDAIVMMTPVRVISDLGTTTVLAVELLGKILFISLLQQPR